MEVIPVISHCPLRAVSFVWHHGDDLRALTLVCKASYELRPDVSPLAQAQDDIHTADIHWGGDARNSLWAPSDLVPFKRRVDVLVTGHAYAPHGQPVRSLFARLVVGAVNKTLAVYGDRSFLPDGKLSQPAELTRMPLCWERAAGGPGTSNPAGIALNPFGSGGDWRWGPNLQPPGIFTAGARDLIPPAGMGPIAPQWPDRLQKLGRSAASWDHRTWHVHPLPGDIDAGYFNSAPPDQQVDHLAPDEHLALDNLHPEHPRLVTRLDGVVPRAVLRRPEQLEQPIHLRCDTLWIDTDRSVCCVVWRGSIPLEATEGAEIHLSADGRHPAPSAPESAAWRGEGSIISASHRGERGIHGSEPDPETGTSVAGIWPSSTGSPLPFVTAAPGTVPSVASSFESRERRAPSIGPRDTVPPSFVVGANDLPFGWTSARRVTPPERSAAPIPVSQEELSPAMIPPARPEPVVVPPPPAMVGAVAIAPESLPALTPSAEPVSLALDPEAVSIERWAEIAAEIDKAQHPRAEVLHARELTEHDFAAVERHWKAALDREAASGGYSLRFEHDAAYVGALERLRGRPLSASEYARILAAGERRQVDATLRELEMPASAHLPIVRQWTARLARDPQLSFEMIQAIAALRGGAVGPAQATS